MSEPLAERMRPHSLDEYVGQQHLVGRGAVLRQMIDAGRISSFILWGPPGVGKTTLAQIIAHKLETPFYTLSAVTSGVKDVRDVIEKAKNNRFFNSASPILFIDEIHRFSKSQQDSLLGAVERGVVTLIGATTENPSFELNNALLSRARVYVLKSLTTAEIEQVLQQAVEDPERGLGKERLILEENLLQVLAEYVNGDARLALNCLELMVDMADETENGKKIDRTLLKEVLGERQARFDKQGDRFYDLISALHKSVRGSAPDAALYWYARILTAGGDPLYVARRLLAIASEDVGNADPRAMQVALAAWDCFTRVGAYEGERAIAQAIIYLAIAPKSNAVYTAFNTAKQQAKDLPDYDVPPHLRNAPTNLMKELGYGAEYRYAHDEPNAYAAGENYFPPELKDTQYYFPTNRGMEIQIKEKLERLREQDKSAVKKRYK